MNTTNFFNFDTQLVETPKINPVLLTVSFFEPIEDLTNLSYNSEIKTSRFATNTSFAACGSVTVSVTGANWIKD